MRAYGRANAALFRERHPDRVKSIKAKEYEAHRATYIERARQWRLANPEKYRAHMRRAYLKAKAAKQAKRCMSCESVLKELNTIYCDWCVNTYKHPCKTSQLLSV